MVLDNVEDIDTVEGALEDQEVDSIVVGLVHSLVGILVLGFDQKEDTVTVHATYLPDL